MMNKWKFLAWGLVVLAAVGMQFVQPARTNPRTHPANSFEAEVQPPQEVAAILNRACRDCHSNQTTWPWYSRVSPVSWLLVRDVRQGRAHINFSDWRGLTAQATNSRMIDVCSETKQGEMPPWYYVPLHRQAKLTPRDVETLCSWHAEFALPVTAPDMGSKSRRD
jgi:hypothetical protein